jgi:hypothetical protein
MNSAIVILPRDVILLIGVSIVVGMTIGFCFGIYGRHDYTVEYVKCLQLLENVK